MCYDAKFGRKKVAENGDDAAGKAVSNGNGNSVTVAIVSNGNKRASEMAVYEQFRSEVMCFGHPSLLENSELAITLFKFR